MLKGKKILLGVTGSIAAYKAAFLIRLLVKEGAEVQPILTDTSRDFVTPLTLATLAKRPALSKFFNENNGVWENHVDLGLWADAMVVAPATANSISKMANGQSDSLLLATYLSARCPVFYAPAMDLDMYAHPATRSNMKTLEERGNMLIKGAPGELASGLEGYGRMAEPEEIVAALQDYFSANLPLSGKKVLISAGPTYEAIDKVRFIGNYSSGKMGYRIADEAARRGAQVTLVSGPSSQTATESTVEVIKVKSAQDMFDACTTRFPHNDIAIMAAAVADFRPKDTKGRKIKKEEVHEMKVDLEPTADILKSLGQTKDKNQILVGFALETDNEIENAQSKLKSKNLDLIVLNSLQDTGAGFDHDTNKVTLIDRQNNITKFELKSKALVAADILDSLQALI